MDVVHEYPDLTVHLTLFHASIAEGVPQKLEHNDIRWITVEEIDQYEFCPADEVILDRLRKQNRSEKRSTLCWPILTLNKEKFALLDKPKPVLQNDRDAIVRVTLASICTSDLHIKHGSVPRRRPASPWVMRWWAW